MTPAQPPIFSKGDTVAVKADCSRYNGKLSGFLCKVIDRIEISEGNVFWNVTAAGGSTVWAFREHEITKLEVQ